MKVAVIRNNSSAAVQYYRSIGVFPHLERDTGGQISFTYYDSNRLQWSDLYLHDIVFVDHPMTPVGTRIIEDAKRQNKKVWIDLDDHLFDIPSGNRSLAYYSNQQNQESVKKVLGMASLITVTTKLLHKVYSEFSDNVHVVPNAWNDYNWRLRQAVPESTVTRIAWRGSDIHGSDLYHVRGVLNEIQKDPAFMMMFFGWNESWGVWLDIDRKRQVVPEMEIFHYFHTFYQSGADFFFYPLIDHPFNKAKSNIAWQEATIAGMATIAPMCMPEFDQPGVMRYKDVRHLKDILKKIKGGTVKKGEHVEMSRAALSDNYRLSGVNQLRLDAIAQMMGTKVSEESKKLKAVR